MPTELLGCSAPVSEYVVSTEAMLAVIGFEQVS
jgi:hypothetical protein